MLACCRFVRPGARRVATSGANLALTDDGYNVVRSFLMNQSQPTTVPLVATSFISPNASTVVCVVLNAGNAATTFKLRDVSTGEPRAAAVTMPAGSIATFTWPL